MGGFFGAVSQRDTVLDVFFGVDYHSHLGTHRGGIAVWNREEGFRRAIHSIENTPFRTRFEKDIMDMKGNVCIGCISDNDPQPLLIASHLGVYAICVIGRMNNQEELVKRFLKQGTVHFEARTGGRINDSAVVASLINEKESFAEGIKYAHEMIDGTAAILIATEKGTIITARDKLGIMPVMIGKSDEGYAVSFESFAYEKMGYKDVRMLGPGECVELNPYNETVLVPPGEKEKFCAFMWTYYGYPNSHYEGSTVEVIRTKGGAVMAEEEKENGTMPEVDAVCGVPDSGIAYAIGYANESDKPFTRPLIKYTPTWPRSFMPDNSALRHHIAKMKLIPVPDLLDGKKLMFIDDSIVRGTQLQEPVDFLYENGAEEVHMRSACPPIMYGCKYLNFSRSNGDMELLARRTIQYLAGDEGLKHIEEYADGKTDRGKCLRSRIAEEFGFSSLEFQSLEGLIKSTGIPADKICTYCWTGKE